MLDSLTLVPTDLLELVPVPVCVESDLPSVFVVPSDLLLPFVSDDDEPSFLEPPLFSPEVFEFEFPSLIDSPPVSELELLLLFLPLVLLLDVPFERFVPLVLLCEVPHDKADPWEWLSACELEELSLWLLLRLVVLPSVNEVDLLLPSVTVVESPFVLVVPVPFERPSLVPVDSPVPRWLCTEFFASRESVS